MKVDLVARTDGNSYNCLWTGLCEISAGDLAAKLPIDPLRTGVALARRLVLCTMQRTLKRTHICTYCRPVSQFWRENSTQYHAERTIAMVGVIVRTTASS
eukprot:COSAG01_NODE_188_length_22632_cov_15.284915_8_plen_100_part_00